MNRSLLTLIWILTVTTLVSFFLPWTKPRIKSGKPLPAEAVQQLTREDEQPWYLSLIALSPEQRAAALNHPLQGHSGWELWVSLREKPERSSELISPNPSTRAFWIYAVPAAALLGAALVTLVPSFGGIVGALLTLGTYLILRVNLRDAQLERMVSDQTLGIGLWISLYALLALSLLLTTAAFARK